MVSETKQKKNIPKLRFPEFNSEWQETVIGNLIIERNEYPDTALPLYSLTIEKGVVPKSDRYERSHLVKSSIDAYKVMHGDDFAFNPMNLRFGAIARYSEKKLVTVSKYYNIFYCKQNTDPRFMETYLTQKSMINFYDRMSIGTLEEKKRVHFSDFCRFVKPFPEHEEQKKIASFLGSVDEWLDNLSKQKTALESYKRGMMQKLFTQQLSFRDENGKDFPAWQQKKLGSVFSAINGIGIPKSDVAEDGKHECVLYGELYTKYREVITNVVSRTNSTEGLPSLNGDLLIPTSTTTSAIDLANVTAINKAGVKLAGGICVLRAKLPVNANFYAYYLSHHKRTELAKYGQGVTIYHIYYSQFKKMEIDLPDVKEQEKIADLLTSIDQAITVKSEEIAKVEQWKKGLMQKMFV